MSTKITTSGVIRNSETPRTGIISCNSCADWIYDEIHAGIDLTYEEFRRELVDELFAEGLTPDHDEWEQRIDAASEGFEPDTSTFLFGNAWEQDIDGRYFVKPGKGKGFAATFESGSFGDIITVEWSEHTTPCHHTSPCFVMADGSGPCGDLDTEGDSVIAYTLPPHMLANAEEE